MKQNERGRRRGAAAAGKERAIEPTRNRRRPAGRRPQRPLRPGAPGSSAGSRQRRTDSRSVLPHISPVNRQYLLTRPAVSVATVLKRKVCRSPPQVLTAWGREGDTTSLTLESEQG